MNSDIKEILISHEEIVNKSKELAEKINADYSGKTPLLVGLLKGCVPFFAELIKHIDIDIEIDFMDIDSYFGGTESTGKIKISKDLSTDITNRDILIVEDIVDTALTLSQTIPYLYKKGASTIEIVTLMDKPSGRKIEGLHPKYIGFTVPKLFLVGFGLDYKGLYRNLPYVGILKEEVYSK